MVNQCAVEKKRKKPGKRKKPKPDGFVPRDIYPKQPFGSFDHVEHARWAKFLELFGIGFEYQPRHFGVSPDFGFRPTFLIHSTDHTGTYWYHICKQPPTYHTIFACKVVAGQTGHPVGITRGQMKLPTLSVMPITYMADEGCQTTRFWSEINRVVELRRTGNESDYKTAKLKQAFLTAMLIDVTTPRGF